MIINCFFLKHGIFFYTHFERDYFSESNGRENLHTVALLCDFF
jgi:hypothetical protein